MEQVLIQTVMHAGRVLVFLTMAVLVLFSIYSLAVIAERWWTFRQARRASAGLSARVLATVERGDLAAALRQAEEGAASFLGPVLAAGLGELLPLASGNPGLHASPALEQASLLARDGMQRATAAQIERLERRLASLATLGNISPFVGLFGTVIGVMRSFEAISQSGHGGLGTVSAGIAEALVATAAGLFVAIPAVTAYNHFISRVKSSVTEMDAAASELLARVSRAAAAQTGR
jgi:biopolymer transport protein ExbB/TolQ